MPKRYSSEQTIRALEKLGFFVVSQKGSHIKMRCPNGGLTIVPRGRKVLPPGTVNGILEKADVSKKLFEDTAS